MKKKITFQGYQDMEDNGFDGKKKKFFFSVVDSSFIGQPEEKQHTEKYHIVVSISGSLLAMWQLGDDDKTIKVLFWYVRRYIQDRVKTNTLTNGEEITLHTANAPAECSFEIDRIPDIHGYSFEVEVDKPKIGFC